MSTMPLLSTGAVQQYPYVCGIAGRTRTFQFADGSEQRYLATPQRRTWSITLRLLQETEKAAFLAFAQDTLRSQASFQFTDPQDGTVYPTCRIAVAPVTDHIDGVAQTGIQYLITEAPE
jgi:hypothetical protein